ncbi:MAG: hypothetical protein DMD63_01375 [Gemmatimonadetes bacterium]|nr:MAG: hypothetical protein DMD63_01375 [Gemmatimonadota bacterium]
MMNQRIPVVLTLLNLLLLCGLALDRVRPAFAKQNASPVLRGRALEIVDAQGRLRATIGVLPSTTVDSKRYPETVLLRLIDPRSGPVVKIGAASNGGALGLTDGADRGVQVFAHDTGSFIRIVDRAGRERVIRP